MFDITNNGGIEEQCWANTNINKFHKSNAIHCQSVYSMSRGLFALIPPGMPEPRVQRVQVHPLPFAFSTLWVQCGCRLWVYRVHKTFTTDRIKRRSRMCVGVFHPAATPDSQEFGKVVIHLAKGETESITYGIFIEALRRNCA
jgi:hypothetical protein